MGDHQCLPSQKQPDIVAQMGRTLSYTNLTSTFRILWFVFSFLCKDGRGSLVNAPFRLRQRGSVASFFHIFAEGENVKKSFHAVAGKKDGVYARPRHWCSEQEHAEGASRNGITSHLYRRAGAMLATSAPPPQLQSHAVSLAHRHIRVQYSEYHLAH